MITFLGLWNSFKKSTFNVTKPVQQENPAKSPVNGFAKKIPTSPPPNKLSPQDEKPFFPFPGNRPFYSCRLSDLASEWQQGWS